MSIATEMLNPQGRMGPKAFQKNGLILVGIGFVISLISLVSAVIGMLLSVLSLALIYPWVVIWVKRLHDSGKSGWLFLLVLLAYLIVSMAVGAVLAAMFVSSSALAGADPVAMMTAMNTASLPTAICGAIIGVVFVLGANAVLKSDPGPNQYGAPATA